CKKSYHITDVISRSGIDVSNAIQSAVSNAPKATIAKGHSRLNDDAAFRKASTCLLAQPAKPKAARPDMKSGSVAGNGVATTSPSSEKAKLNRGGVAPPTMSVPSRSQSGSKLAFLIHPWRSDPAGVPEESQ